MKKMLTVDNLVVALLVLVAAFLAPNLNLKALQVFDLTAVRVVAMVVVVLVCLYKPVYALLLAIILVVCLQRLHNLKKTNLVLNAVLNNVSNEGVSDEGVSDEGVSDEGGDEEGADGEESVNVESSDDVNNMNNGLVNNGVVNDEENVVLSPVEEGGMTNVNYNLTPLESNNEVSNENAYNNVDQLEVHVIGALLNEGFENPLNNTVVDNSLSVENTSANNNVNNVLTAEVPVTDPVNTLNNVSNVTNVSACEVKTKRKLFADSNPCTDTLTSNKQLKDIQTNFFSCEGSIKSTKEQLSAQGRGNNSGITGYDSKYY